MKVEFWNYVFGSYFLFIIIFTIMGLIFNFLIDWMWNLIFIFAILIFLSFIVYEKSHNL